METEKTAAANEDGHVYSQVEKKVKKGTLYNPVFIQLTLNQLRGDGQWEWTGCQLWLIVFK